jgi:hypothetical protein
VSREASVRAYEQLFLLLGVMILTLLPLLFLLKVDRNATAHGEPESEGAPSPERSAEPALALARNAAE